MNSSDANKETDVLKMVKADVLRILVERKEKVSLEVIKAKIRVSHSFTSKTIRNLKEEKLIQVENKFIRLTKKGRHEAKDVVKKHLALENYFEETRGKKRSAPSSSSSRTLCFRGSYW